MRITGLMLLLCFSLTARSGPDCETITRENSDQCIRLNQIQVLGTHNSYKLAPSQELVAFFDQHRPGWSKDLEYGHRPLQEQLNRGIRQLELDVFADPEGGLYAKPAGAVLAADKDSLQRREMLNPGFKVLHVQDIDFRANCLTLIACLEEIKSWSDRHPQHLPIMILLEVKDRVMPDFGPLRYTRPIPVSAANLGEIDREIRSVFADSRIITPDFVRGDYDSLQASINNKGWPTLAESRGKVLFALDNTDTKRSDYLADAPMLQKRVMFVSSDPEQDTAGFIKMNDAVKDHELIEQYVSAGFLVRTRSDVPTQEARSGSTERRDRALKSGAQYISTDYYEESPFDSGYRVDLPDTDGAARCNPVSAPAGCRDEFLSE
ncbi:hypothetical protein F6455_07505 [Proteobacteria bacterium 005FR1]|nr:hypothetical protein [Proteobacteria bacterium 005FR1]